MLQLNEKGGVTCASQGVSAKKLMACLNSIKLENKVFKEKHFNNKYFNKNGA